jgi:general stress protein 26
MEAAVADATDRNTDREVPLEKKLDDLYDLIDGIDIAMLTTRTIDGSLVSRPLQTQKRTDDMDLWFMTTTDTHKVDEIRANPEVNVSYYKDGSREWVSVRGRARVTQDRKRIHELYKPDWKAWLEDEGGERDGGPDDPRIALIVVEPQSVVYLKSDQPRVVTMFKVMKALATGEPPKVGSLRQVDRGELDSGAGSEAR